MDSHLWNIPVNYFKIDALVKEFLLIISKSMHWLRRRSHLKVFLFLALAAILFNGAERFEQFW